jgi:hypothetical protein
MQKAGFDQSRLEPEQFEDNWIRFRVRDVELQLDLTLRGEDYRDIFFFHATRPSGLVGIMKDGKIKKGEASYGNYFYARAFENAYWDEDRLTQDRKRVLFSFRDGSSKHDAGIICEGRACDVFASVTSATDERKMACEGHITNYGKDRRYTVPEKYGAVTAYWLDLEWKGWN